jgi:hypothetical protein
VGQGGAAHAGVEVRPGLWHRAGVRVRSVGLAGWGAAMGSGGRVTGQAGAG